MRIICLSYFLCILSLIIIKLNHNFNSTAWTNSRRFIFDDNSRKCRITLFWHSYSYTQTQKDSLIFRSIYFVQLCYCSNLPDFENHEFRQHIKIQLSLFFTIIWPIIAQLQYFDELKPITSKVVYYLISPATVYRTLKITNSFSNCSLRQGYNKNTKRKMQS